MKSLYAQIKNAITVKVYDQKPSTYNYTYINKGSKEKVYLKWYHRLIFKKTTVYTHYEGYYEDYYNMGFNKYKKLYTVKELQDMDYVVDTTEKIVYDKPSLEIRFSNKDSFSKKFNSIRELEEFLQPLLNKNKDLIKIV